MADTVTLIDCVGEGKTDMAKQVESPSEPTSGVIPILTHKICGKPAQMRVRRRAFAFLQGKDRLAKFKFAKLKASCGAKALVIVMDTEGDDGETLADLIAMRDKYMPSFPSAIGVAHPCIESWLLSDAKAIRHGLGLPGAPSVPDAPESLPAPCKHKTDNPKMVLARCADRTSELYTKEKDAIASNIRDTSILSERCPISFKPFADEVKAHIAPLFASPAAETSEE